MPKLTIDNRNVTAPPGATILDAAKSLGIDIPHLCSRDGCSQNSCLVCVVKIRGRHRYAPACSTKVTEGMIVESECDEIRLARRTAIELLLSDHAGECLAPCRNICPAHMDVPRMIRQILEGDLRGAIATVKEDIPLPAALGRVCPAPCEAGCRHSPVGGSLSVCLLKRFVADADLARNEPYVPAKAAASGRSVAVIGAGPTGLTAAYFLLRAGHACHIYERGESPGGRLLNDVAQGHLDASVLTGEIDVIRRMGAVFHLNAAVGPALPMAELARKHHAVLIATGHAGVSGAAIAIDDDSYQTTTPGIFAAGGAVHRSKLAVHSVADGKAAAACVCQYLDGRAPHAPPRPFTTRLGKLAATEVEDLHAATNDVCRQSPAAGLAHGFDEHEALAEAQRCLSCSCECEQSCTLRSIGASLGANSQRFRGPRRLLETPLHVGQVVFEQGKCISCGICVDITHRAGEPVGLTFIGRGFEMRLAAPFGRSIGEGLGRSAELCIEACPTGALAWRTPRPE